MAPRPMDSIAATMRPSRPSTRSAIDTMRAFGVAVGETVHHQRPRAIPTTHKADELGDMLFAREDVTVHWLGNVVHAEDEVVALGDVNRPLHPVGMLEQGDNMQRAGLIDCFMEARKRADVDHRILDRLLRRRRIYGAEFWRAKEFRRKVPRDNAFMMGR